LTYGCALSRLRFAFSGDRLGGWSGGLALPAGWRSVDRKNQ
jgi:hypothetical protein